MRNLTDVPTHVYLCGFTGGVVKVGVTANYSGRFYTLSSAGLARGLKMKEKEILWTGRRSMAFAIERELIFALAEKYRNTALDIEWFEGARFSAVKSICQEVISGPREYRPNAYYRFRRGNE